MIKFKLHLEPRFCSEPSALLSEGLWDLVCAEEKLWRQLLSSLGLGYPTSLDLESTLESFRTCSTKNSGIAISSCGPYQVTFTRDRFFKFTVCYQQSNLSLTAFFDKPELELQGIPALEPKRRCLYFLGRLLTCAKISHPNLVKIIEFDMKSALDELSDE